MFLFYSHFSSRKLVCNENYRVVGHAVDRFVDAIDRRFSCSPLLNRDYGSPFEFRCAREKVLLRKNIAPSLEGDSNPRNLHSGSFAEAEEGPRHPSDVASCSGVLTLSSIELYYISTLSSFQISLPEAAVANSGRFREGSMTTCSVVAVHCCLPEVAWRQHLNIVNHVLIYYLASA